MKENEGQTEKEVTNSLIGCCEFWHLATVKIEYEAILRDAAQSGKMDPSKIDLPSHIGVEVAISFIRDFLFYLPDPLIGNNFFNKYITNFSPTIGNYVLLNS